MPRLIRSCRRKEAPDFFEQVHLKNKQRDQGKIKKIYTIEPFVYADAQMSIQRLRELQSQKVGTRRIRH